MGKNCLDAVLLNRTVMCRKRVFLGVAGRVDLSVRYAGGSLSVSALAGNANLWLGEKRGKFLYLR